MVPAVLLVAGVSQLLLGAWAFVSPGSFYDAIAAYPPENDHFLKDVGSWQVALGAAAVIAARTPSWQRGMLAVLAVQYGLHAISHAIDLDQAESDATGVATLIALIAAAVLLGGLFVRERDVPR
jgi:predicted anti-sigma-YlaC factor YlaD